MTTTLSLWGHSCVRFERDSRVLVVDPGSWSDVAGALGGADAVLITHEHPDHLDVRAVADAAAAGADVLGPTAVVHALADAGAPGERLHALEPGQTLTVAGLRVDVLGRRHAVVHPDLPVIDNFAYLVEGTALHPGDSWTLPPAGATVDVLLLPIGAPWLRAADAVDHVRAVGPRRVVPIHDAGLSEAGRRLVVDLVARLGGAGDVLQPGRGERLHLLDDGASVAAPVTDESVPPRPEEEIADVARSRPDPEGHGG